MKKTFATLGMSACLLAVLSSCQSTDGDGYGDWEEATPMSEMSVADGEIPPWLLEDDGSTQVDAGDYTPDARNQYAIPDPEAEMADSGASGSAGQNQPAMASTQDEDTTVETPDIPAEVNVVDPLMQPGAPAIAAVPAEQVSQTPAKTTIVKKPQGATTSKPKTATTSTKKPAANKIAAKKTSTTKKQAKKSNKPDKPTLVTYKVRPGDNLSEIAERSNTTVAQIRKDSNLRSSVIHPGQIIKVRYIPKGYKPEKVAAKGKTHVVARGESIGLIAKRNGVTVQDILRANNIAAKDAAKIHPGKRLVIPAKGSTAGKVKGDTASTPRSHTVARGESLSTIAQRYGLTVQELCKANKLSTKQADKIRAGQKLTIPSKQTAKKTTKKRR